MRTDSASRDHPRHDHDSTTYARSLTSTAIVSRYSALRDAMRLMHHGVTSDLDSVKTAYESAASRSSASSAHLNQATALGHSGTSCRASRPLAASYQCERSFDVALSLRDPNDHDTRSTQPLPQLVMHLESWAIALGLRRCRRSAPRLGDLPSRSSGSSSLVDVRLSQSRSISSSFSSRESARVDVDHDRGQTAMRQARVSMSV